MKLLFTSPYDLNPPYSGAAVRTLNLAHSFAKQGHDVRVCGANRAAFLPGALQNRAFAAGSGWRRLLVGKFSQMLEQELQQWRPDKVIVSYPFQSRAVIPLCRRYQVPFIYDAHNVESHRVRATHGRLAGAVVSRWERAMLQNAERIWTVSENEAVIFRKQSAAPVVLLPNGVQSEVVKLPSIEPESATVGFLGNFFYRPNWRALEYLRDEVMPRLRKEKITSRFLIVGPGGEKFSSPADEWEVLGGIADLSSVLSRAAWWLAPLFQGGGTRIKILEALNMGRRVLATPKAVEGLSVGEAEGVRVVDAEMFTRALKGILTSEEVFQWNKAGEKFVARFDWDRLVKGSDAFGSHHHAQ